jgi:hypothetical protein
LVRLDEILKVIWDGEEQQGMTLYGLWQYDLMPTPAFPTLIFPTAELRVGKLRGEGWQLYGWDVLVPEWPGPSTWTQTIARTLAPLVAAGATVAWGAIEGRFVEPASSLDPIEMSGGVWAFMTSDGDFQCAALADPFAPVSDPSLARLRAKLGFKLAK